MAATLQYIVTGKRSDIRRRLFCYLDDGVSLHRLRAASRTLNKLISRFPERLFRDIYIRAPLPYAANMHTLAFAVPFCQSLTVKVGCPHPLTVAAATAPSPSQKGTKEDDGPGDRQRRPSLWRRRSMRDGSKPEASPPTLHQPLKQLFTTIAVHSKYASMTDRLEQIEFCRSWARLLSRFEELRLLTLRVNGDPAWPGKTAVEDMLVTLRMAIETAALPFLHQFSLEPVHAMGILHLRWYGMGAFTTSTVSASNAWRQVDTLDLRIHNPFAAEKLTSSQQLMFRKVFYDYLRSFAPFLKCLRLIWLGGEGPSPLAMHHEPGLEARPPLRWPKLEELWVGNIKLPNQTLQLAREVAQPTTSIKILRTTMKDDKIPITDSSAWIDVTSLPLPQMPMMIHDDRASSVYSQREMSAISAWAGGISRSSREVMFMLDF